MAGKRKVAKKPDRLKSVRGGILGRTARRRMPRMDEILNDGPTPDRTSPPK